MSIAFKKTFYDEREAGSIKNALNGTDYLAKVKAYLSAQLQNDRIFLTTSGSSAFDLLFAALNLEAGQEVILPSFTFPSAANTALRAGLRPVFADIDMHSKTLNIESVRQKITDKTACVITTHYGGSSVDMENLTEAAKGVLIIEDAALSYGARYKGKPLGTIGDMGVFSFHRTKNISADEGGMLVINKNGPVLLQRIQTIYDNGTDKADFLLGRTESYTWKAAGINCAMPNLCAALLYAQLQKNDEILEKQRSVCARYEENLAPLAEKFGFELPRIPAYNKDNFHVFYLLFRDRQTRETVRKALNERGIDAYFHYMPLHASKMGKALGYEPGSLPSTVSVSERILRLPVYAGLSGKDCDTVVSSIREILCSI